jgi:hypothetical protein
VLIQEMRLGRLTPQLFQLLMLLQLLVSLVYSQQQDRIQRFLREPPDQTAKVITLIELKGTVLIKKNKLNPICTTGTLDPVMDRLLEKTTFKYTWLAHLRFLYCRMLQDVLQYN